MPTTFFPAEGWGSGFSSLKRTPFASGSTMRGGRRGTAGSSLESVNRSDPRLFLLSFLRSRFRLRRGFRLGFRFGGKPRAVQGLYLVQDPQCLQDLGGCLVHREHFVARRAVLADRLLPVG